MATNTDHHFYYQITTQPVPVIFDPALAGAWREPWSLPVKPNRDPRATAALAAPFLAYPYQTVIEPITPDKWFAPLSEPVRYPPALKTALQRDNELVIADFGELVIYSKFSYPWSEPVRFKRDPRAEIVLIASGGYYTVEPLAEAVQLKWYAPLSEPVRLKPGLQAALQQTEAYVNLSFFVQVPRVHGYIII